jgi:hypothetical protein
LWLPNEKGNQIVARYNAPEEAGYTDIVQTDTIVSWDLALKITRHGRPITTKAIFHAKKDGKCFRLMIERHYRNRGASDPEISLIASATEVTADEYDTTTAKIGPFHTHPRF